MRDDVAVCPTLQINADMGIRMLALVVGENADETYHVSFRIAPGGPFTTGIMTHAHGDEWDLLEDGASSATRVTWTSPDAVFALALGQDASDVTAAAPHWPAPVMDRLLKRRLSGPGTVAFDAGWFLAELATSALDRPLLLLDATSKLGLTGLERATATLSALAAEEHEASDTSSLADLLVRALDAERPIAGTLAWNGAGRLIGEHHGGELSQLGADIGRGCRAALGTGPLRVMFRSREPLGLGLGPLLPTDAPSPPIDAQHIASAGAGCVVGEVDPGGAAERAGVMPGMALSHLSNPYLHLPTHGPDALSFEEVLDAIDTRRAKGRSLTITFNTAAPVTHLYAVEMPAAATLRTLAAMFVGGRRERSRDVGVGAALDALCGRTLVWREGTPRLFLGEAGSVSDVHTDMCPQVQMAHALVGTKLLGVASHHATSRLSAEHIPANKGKDGDIPDHEATIVQTDRPLTARASRLLCDPEMSIAVLQTGDLAVFDSGALHFASNGAEAISGALYHGLITPAAVPRLRLAAAAHSRSWSPASGAYSGHLFAPELLRLVERRLAVFSKVDARMRESGTEQPA